MRISLTSSPISVPSIESQRWDTSFNGYFYIHYESTFQRLKQSLPVRGLHRAAIFMAGCSPWLTGRTGWNKYLEAGYGYGYGYTIFLKIYFYSNC